MCVVLTLADHIVINLILDYTVLHLDLKKDYLTLIWCAQVSHRPNFLKTVWSRSFPETPIFWVHR